jgi:hypothetical protein
LSIARRNLQSPIYNSPATPCISNKSDIAFQNQITTQSSCRLRGGTSRPCSSASGHGCANTLSINCAMVCVRMSTDHDKFVTVSYSMIFPKWQLSNTKYVRQRGTREKRGNRLDTGSPWHILLIRRSKENHYKHPSQSDLRCAKRA